MPRPAVVGYHAQNPFLKGFGFLPIGDRSQRPQGVSLQKMALKSSPRTSLQLERPCLRDTTLTHASLEVPNPARLRGSSRWLSFLGSPSHSWRISLHTSRL